MLTSSFLFYSDGAHRDLHSFPTRRSSDLRHRGPELPRRHHPRRVRVRLVAGEHVIDQGRYGVYVARRLRSEEHTSELQSRRDLVCRLLLEKKKKLTNTARWLS